MIKIAVTGFLPFNGRDINPSQLLAEALSAPEGTILVRKILPVEYKNSGEILKDFLVQERPDYLLSLGQAGNVPHISVERVAVNLDNTLCSDGKTFFPDQAGFTPVDVKILPDGPSAYFSTLPVWDCIRAVNEAGVPAAASYSAGTFICNHVMYIGCHLAEQSGSMKADFVHVPFLPEQLPPTGSLPGRYSMPFKEMLKGIQVILDTLAKQSN